MRQEQHGYELLYKSIAVAFSMPDKQTVITTLEELLKASVSANDVSGIAVFAQALTLAQSLR